MTAPFVRRMLQGFVLLCVLFAAPAVQALPVHGRPVAHVSMTLAAPVPAILAKEDVKTAEVVRIALILSLMALLPALLICTTSFVRIVVVLSMIRHAFGMPETPPNQVLVSLAIFLTAFSMMPTFEAINSRALQPFLDGHMTIQEAVNQGSGPAREFMLRQVRDQDIKAVYDISRKPLPSRAADVGLMQLIPAFMLNELRVAFRIGFVVMLPFLLIDLVVSSILLALGMLMVPPTTLSLPIKVLMFVLIDGWSLVLQGVLGSFR
jgi:flagellar biosynthetic protein FliP